MNDNGWPSVTEVLRDFGIINYFRPPGAAAERGRLVHTACALLAQGEEIDREWIGRHPDLLPYIDGFVAALAGPLRTWRPLSFESEIVNEGERYVGHSDQEDGEALLELKTGVYPEWSRLQTAAYCIGRRIRRFVLTLPGDGRYKLIQHDDPLDKDRFILLVRAWWVRTEFRKAGESNA